MKVPEVAPKPKKEETEVEGEKKEGEKKDDDNEKPPLGNGGRTDRYIWTQVLEEVNVYVPIP